MISHRVTSIPSGFFTALLALTAAACSSTPTQLAMLPGADATTAPATLQGVLPAPYVGADQSAPSLVRQGGG